MEASGSTTDDTGTCDSTTSATQSAEFSGPSGSKVAIHPQKPAQLQLGASAQFYPYPNWSSFELGDLFWSHGPTNSLHQFSKLVQLLNDPKFSLDEVRGTNWSSIRHRLADGEPAKLDSNGKVIDDRGPGWKAAVITVKVPFPTRGHGEKTEDFDVGILHHRRIVAVIKEKLLDLNEHATRHFRAHRLFWQPDLSQDPVRVYGEAYSSDEFCKMEEEVQGLTLSVEDQGLERVVIALMFWTDATLLADFGTAKLWPCYLFFGNDSKYLRAKPGTNLCNHIAYFEDVGGSVCVTTHTKRICLFSSQNLSRTGIAHITTAETRPKILSLIVKENSSTGNGINSSTTSSYKPCKEVSASHVSMALRGSSSLASLPIQQTTPKSVSCSSCMCPFLNNKSLRATIATIKAMGAAPCPRCLMKKCEMHDMGSEEDSMLRTIGARVDDANRQEQVRLAREKIFDEGYVVNSTKVGVHLKDDSMLPIDVGPLFISV
jgi:Plavaka transposase